MTFSPTSSKYHGGSTFPPATEPRMDAKLLLVYRAEGLCDLGEILDKPSVGLNRYGDLTTGNAPGIRSMRNSISRTGVNEDPFPASRLELQESCHSEEEYGQSSHNNRLKCSLETHECTFQSSYFQWTPIQDTSELVRGNDYFAGNVFSGHSYPFKFAPGDTDYLALEVQSLNISVPPG
ncbi:hypothetical protein Tco_0835300 [Tanacetum coccineum]